MVRKERFKKEEIIAALIKSMGIVSEAARLLGCDRSTVQRYIDKYPDIAEKALEGRLEIIDLAQVAIVEGLQTGEVKDRISAGKFVLATIGGWRQNLALTGADGGPIQTEDQTAADAQEVKSKLEQLIKQTKGKTSNEPSKPKRRRTSKPKV